MIYIVTRDRLALLRKVMPYWLEQELPITLVVESSESRIHSEFVAELTAAVRILAPGDNLGIGQIRRSIFDDAVEKGLAAIIMADDDIRPTKSIRPLLSFIRGPTRAIGIGTVKPGYGQFMDAATLNSGRPVLHTGSMGLQIAAWNVRRVMEVGGHDPKLDVQFEDHELLFRGIMAKYPWYLHTAVFAHQVANRFSPGGLATATGNREAREVGIERCAEYCREKYPAYVSRRGTPYRFYWSRLLDDTYGKVWREYLHKGVMP
jgi:hypothetical protein